MSWITVIPKAFGLLFSGTGKIFMKLITLKLLMTSLVTIIFAIVLLSSGIQQSIHQKSIMPFVFGFGELVFNVDSKISKEVSAIKDSSISLARFFLLVSGEIWVYVILFRVWYAVWSFLTGSQMPIIAVLLAFLSLAAFQVIYIAITYKTFYAPYSGLFRLLTSIFTIVDFTDIKDKFLAVLRRA